MCNTLDAKDTPHWELLLSIALKWKASPSGHTHLCQKYESTSTVKPKTNNKFNQVEQDKAMGKDNLLVAKLQLVIMFYVMVIQATKLF